MTSLIEGNYEQYSQDVPANVLQRTDEIARQVLSGRADLIHELESRRVGSVLKVMDLMDKDPEFHELTQEVGSRQARAAFFKALSAIDTQELI